MFDLNYLFQLFEWHACKLACVAKCMSTINNHLTNKHLTFDSVVVEEFDFGLVPRAILVVVLVRGQAF